MNCIDCKWAIQLDKTKQCKRANPEIRDCDKYEKIKRKVERKKEDGRIN